MWALIVDGSINRIFKVPEAFTHPTTGIQYPSNWLTLATAQEKKDVGFIEVTINGSYKDDKYYLDQESSPVYDASAGTVTITRSAVARNLAQLQKEFKASITQKAWVNIGETDWYVIRKQETSTAIPAKITAFRTATRLVANSHKTAVDNASDVDELAATYNNADGIDPSQLTVDGSQTSVVNTTSNAITKNGHGLSNDEYVLYSSGSGNDPIGGLVSGNYYYVFGKTVNTFKLSHTNSHMGDAATISLTGVGEGSNHTFTSQGIPPVGASWPSLTNPVYDVDA
tara:strand:- start:62 stop:913 length:852 start_codon:yes stop_codon:yes gene_type:complete